jgi:antitoxin HicB
MLDYPVELADDDGTVLVTFPDVPEAITYGADKAEALKRAVDALETALSFYVDARKPLPKPSPRRGRPTVAPSLQGALKLELYNAMRQAGVTKAALARRLGWHAPQVDRLLDLTHASRAEQIEAALAALGRRAEVRIKAA